MNYSPPKAWFYLKKRQGMGAGSNVGPGRLALKDLAQQLFGRGEDGFLFGNWSELEELFLLSNGSTGNVAADNDPCGLALDDHSWVYPNLARQVAAQAELVSNPGPAFVSTTGWTPQTNTPTLSIVGGRLRTTTTTGSGGGVSRMSSPLTCVVGRTYRIAYSIEASVDPNINILVSANANLNSAVLSLGAFSGLAAAGTAEFVATATTMYVGVSFGAPTAVGNTVDLNFASIKLMPGNHALTATGTQRPLWHPASGKPYLSLDGSDDRLVSPTIPSANYTLAVAANWSAVSDVAIGGGASTGGKRAFIGTDAGGGIGYGWGDVNTLTNSTTSILNANHVAILSGQGTTRVRLWLDGVLKFNNSTISTAPDGTGGGVALGAYNNNGTPASFMAGNLFAALVLNRVVTDAEVLNITKQFQKAYQ